MKKYIAPFFLFAVIGNVQAAEITETHVTGTRFKFTAKLDAPLIAGNKVKIDFGKNLVPMTCVETTCTLFRTMNSDMMPAYKIGIYNSKNVLQSTNLDANSTTNLPVYTKIANDGSELLDSAKLGSNPKDWACTKDNKTGLIWEVKTTDGGLRDLNKTYTNYTLDYPKCGLSGCETYGQYGDDTNTDGFVTNVNNQSLCGATNWRLPTNEELKGLVYYSNGKYNKLTEGEGDSGFICGSDFWDSVKTTRSTVTTQSTINATYFPNTIAWLFWSSSPYAGYGRLDAWYVHFGSGYSDGCNKNYDGGVRLVRNAQ
jgi:hypothetical protein